MRMFTNLTVQFNVHRNGQLLFISDAIVGCVGYITGLKPGKFAVTVDTRHTGNQLENLIDIVSNIDLPALWLLRKTFEEEDTFEGAIR